MLRLLLLVLLVLQNLAQVFLMRWTQIRATGPGHLPSTAIFLTESLKMGIILLLLLFRHGLALPRQVATLVANWRDTVRFAVPAFCFNAQTHLLWLGITLLDAPTYMVTGQLKVSLTALFAVQLLGMQLSTLQKLALVLLQVGVILVQVNEIPATDRHSSADLETDASVVEYFTGVVVVIAACASSGFASVYFERLLKTDAPVPRPETPERQPEASALLLRQLQLCMWALPFTFFSMLLLDGALVAKQGVLLGYDKFVWAAVVNSSCGGLLVAAVVKYADNILKSFATSVSIVLAAVLSTVLFDFVITPGFVVGTVMVTVAVFVYSTRGTIKKEANEEETAASEPGASQLSKT
jgi:solute carrier family 35 (UDP-sugar transporter), member A1/2/3